MAQLWTDKCDTMGFDRFCPNKQILKTLNLHLNCSERNHTSTKQEVANALARFNWGGGGRNNQEALPLFHIESKDNLS